MKQSPIDAAIEALTWASMALTPPLNPIPAEKKRIAGLCEAAANGLKTHRETELSNKAKAGATKTEAKTEAARANGAKGGRPRKPPQSE